MGVAKGCEKKGREAKGSEKMREARSKV